jgi:peptidoglycan/xylan/chitin deacetylase (PgdA/CDA1 family)
MKAPFPLLCCFTLLGAAHLAPAQVVPLPAPDSQPAPLTNPTPATPEAPSEVRVMRAIPLEAEPPVNVESLPRTMPAEARVVYSQCLVESPVIALTFDDGPHKENTPRLLDMLKERGIKATFFLVGRNAAAYPDIVKRIVDEGHEVANHTWTHNQLSRMSDTKVFDELQKTHDAIVQASGVAPILCRPPYGALRIRQRKTIHDHFGYPVILWDVDPHDWQSPRTVAKVHDRVLAQTKPGSIILCHDIHQPTIDAMPSTLDELIARGFKFATVTQLINLEVQTAQKHAALAAKAEEASAATPPPSTPANPPVVPQQ